MKETMTLGQLIDALAACGAKYVAFASPERLVPTIVTSYRGYYEDLAIEYTADALEQTVETFLGILRGAVGATFEGYKGGTYRMSRDTLVWVSNYGEARSARVTGVDVDDDTAYLTMTIRWCK